MSGKGTPALAALDRAGVTYTLHEYDAHPGPGAGSAHSAGYGTDAAKSLGQDPRRLFKTLVAEVDGRLAVAVVPVAGSLNLKAFAAAIGGKRAVLADPVAAERSSGYVRGGISPLGQRRPLPTVVDVSAQDWPTVLVSAGRRGLQVQLAAPELIRLCSATVAAIAS